MQVNSGVGAAAADGAVRFLVLVQGRGRTAAKRGGERCVEARKSASFEKLCATGRKLCSKE